MTSDPELLKRWQKIAEQNELTQLSSSMVLNDTKLQSGNNVIAKEIKYTRRNRKLTAIPTVLRPIKILLLKDNKLWIGGDREEAQEIFNLEDLPTPLTYSLMTFKLTNTGVDLDDRGVLDIAQIAPYTSIVITSEGFEIQELGSNFNESQILDQLISGFRGTKINLEGFGNESNLVFPYKAQKAYFDVISNFINTEESINIEENSTVTIPINEDLNYSTTALSFIFNKKLVFGVDLDASALLLDTGNIPFNQVVYFDTESDGVLPSPLEPNTPYIAARGTGDSDRIILAPYTPDPVFIPSEDLIVLTSEGSGSFYCYLLGACLTNYLSLAGVNKSSYLLYESELDPNYMDTIDDSFPPGSPLRLKGYKLLINNQSFFYDKDTIINTPDGFEITLNQYTFSKPLLNSNIVIDTNYSGVGDPNINTEDDVVSNPIAITTFNTDLSITIELLNTEFIPPSDRFDEENNLTYLQIGTSIYI